MAYGLVKKALDFGNPWGGTLDVSLFTVEDGIFEAKENVQIWDPGDRSKSGIAATVLYRARSTSTRTFPQRSWCWVNARLQLPSTTVVRLKGGDPLVFGKGGKEMDFLRQQGIQVKVILGITAAPEIAAELRLPWTHRCIANSVRFLRGHPRKGGKDPLFVAEHAADSDPTLVVYMGLATPPSLVQKLAAFSEANLEDQVVSQEVRNVRNSTKLVKSLTGITANQPRSNGASEVSFSY